MRVRRIYDVLLNEWRPSSAEGRNNILQFLARALRSVDPFPDAIRRLTRNIVSNSIETASDRSADRRRLVSRTPDPLGSLITSCTSHREIVREEARKVIGEFIESGDPRLRINARRLTASLTMIASITTTHTSRAAWSDLEDELVESYAFAIAEAAALDLCVLTTALQARILTLREVLATPGGVTALLMDHRRNDDEPGQRHERHQRPFGKSSHGDVMLPVTVHLPTVKRGCQKLRGQKRTEMKYCIQLWSDVKLAAVDGIWGGAVLWKTPIRM